MLSVLKGNIDTISCSLMPSCCFACASGCVDVHDGYGGCWVLNERLVGAVALGDFVHLDGVGIVGCSGRRCDGF